MRVMLDAGWRSSIRGQCWKSGLWKGGVSAGTSLWTKALWRPGRRPEVLREPPVRQHPKSVDAPGLRDEGRWIKGWQTPQKITFRSASSECYRKTAFYPKLPQFSICLMFEQHEACWGHLAPFLEQPGAGQVLSPARGCGFPKGCGTSGGQRCPQEEPSDESAGLQHPLCPIPGLWLLEPESAAHLPTHRPTFSIPPDAPSQGSPLSSQFPYSLPSPLSPPCLGSSSETSQVHSRKCGNGADTCPTDISWAPPGKILVLRTHIQLWEQKVTKNSEEGNYKRSEAGPLVR